jgi:hypothetical protein
LAGSFHPIIIKQIPERRQNAPLIDLLHGLYRGNFIIRRLVTAGKELFEGAFAARSGALLTLQPGQSPRRVIIPVIWHYGLP